MSDELEKLRDRIIETAWKKGAENIDLLTRLVERTEDLSILKELLARVANKKWYQTVSPFTGEITDTPATQIGDALENLVKVALKNLGCSVQPQGEIWTLISDIPTFDEEGEFRDRGIAFTHQPRGRDRVDFTSKDIAIEVKNIDPAHPFRTDDLFKKEVLNRFRKIRKKRRYLLITRGVLNDHQRKLLGQKKIEEINFGEQLRKNNQKEVYEDLFYALRHVLSTLPP